MTKKRAINLARRQVKMTNLNFQPEKAGDDLVERADLSFEVLLDETDIGQVLSTRGNPLKILWDKDGEPALNDLGAAIALDLKVDGTLTLQAVGGISELAFTGAILKKLKLEPIIGRKAKLYCQVRVDPTGVLEELGQMRIREECAFAYAGSGAAEKDTSQQQMNV